MKLSKLFIFALFASLALVYSCQETFNNPLDPDVEDVEPQAPVGLEFQVFADSLVRLTWSAGFNYGFEVSRNGLDIAELEPEPDKVDGGNFFYNDNSNLDVNQDYTYEVFTLLPNGSRAGASAEVTVTFDGPSDLVANVQNDTTIVLSWIDNSAFEEGYEIKRRSSGEAQTTIGSIGANRTSFTDNGPLLVDRSYTYEVIAFTERSTSESDSVSASFDFQGPTDLSVEQIAESTLRLEWTDNSSVETGYRIERKVNTGNFTVIEEIGPNVTEFEDTFSFSNGDEIAYAVSALTNYNSSDPSNGTMTIQFQAPSNVSASYNAETGFINLSWSDNTAYENAFTIERSVSGGSFAQIAQTAANVTSYTDEGPFAEGQSYSYRIKAVASTLESSFTATSGTPTPPAAPTNFAITIQNESQIQLSWTDNSAFEAGYQIYSRTDSLASFEPLSSTGADITSANVNLSISNFYRFMFRIVSLGEGINSTFAEIDSTFIIPIPSLTAATQQQNGAVRISWSEIDFPKTGFTVYSTDNFGTQTTLGSVGSNEQFIDVSTLQTFRDYTIQVATRFGTIESARSAGRNLKRVIENAEIVQTISTGVGNLNAVKRSQVSSAIIVGGSNGWEVWNIPRDYSVPSRLGGGSAGVNITAVSGAEEFAMYAAGDENGNVYLIEDNSYTISSTISDHTAAITSLYLGFSDELITGSADSTMRLYDAQREFSGVTTNQGSPVYDISIEFVGGLRYIVTHAGAINFYRYNNNFELGSRAYGRSPKGQSLTFTYWGSDQVLAVANTNDDIFLLKDVSPNLQVDLDANDIRVSSAFGLHGGKVIAIEFLEGKSFISASETGKMQLWDIDQPSAADVTDPLLELTHPHGAIADGTTFSGNEGIGFAAAHTNGTVSLWKENLIWKFVD